MGALLLISGFTSVCAGEVCAAVIEQKATTLWATSDMNFKDFEVNADEEGLYFSEFWLLPAQHPDQCYTAYQVYPISADEDMRNISVYGIQGEYIGSVKASAPEISLPVSALNISKAGCYVIKVDTNSGSFGKKVFIK